MSYSNTGVYQIRNLSNYKCYIGSVSSHERGGFLKRWQDHLLLLRKNEHHSQHLQHAWNHYGEPCFVFEIVEQCEPDQCLEREQHYLNLLLRADKDDARFRQLGYNICRTARSCLGVMKSTLTKLKLRTANLGKRLTPETKQKMSIARMGKYQGENHPGAKLCANDVVEIQRLLAAGVTQTEIAQRFSVAQNAISRIKNRKTWSHIEVR